MSFIKSIRHEATLTSFLRKNGGEFTHSVNKIANLLAKHIYLNNCVWERPASQCPNSVRYSAMTSIFFKVHTILKLNTTTVLFGTVPYMLMLIYSVLHTYINGHYSSLLRIIDLVCHTTNVVRVNFAHKYRNIHFQVVFDLLHNNFIYLQDFLRRNQLIGSQQRNILFLYRRFELRPYI